MAKKLIAALCSVFVLGIAGMFIVFGAYDMRPELDSRGLVLAGAMASLFGVAGLADIFQEKPLGAGPNVMVMPGVTSAIFGMFAFLVVYAPESINMMIHGPK